MALTLDPRQNPLLRLYGLAGRSGAACRDGARHLETVLPLTALERGELSELALFLRERAGPALAECSVTLDGQVLAHLTGEVRDWLQWRAIREVRERLGAACRDLLSDLRRRLKYYAQDRYWPGTGDPVEGCLAAVEELGACAAAPLRLRVSLRKADLLEQHILAPARLAGRVSALVWRDLTAMAAAFDSFSEFLELMAPAAQRPILLLFYEPTAPYAGDWFRVASLGGPPDSQPEREAALAAHLAALSGEAAAEYAEVRSRHRSESRTREGEVLDLPPALLLRPDGQAPSWPAHPVFAEGPLRSLQVYALLAWLAERTERTGDEARFLLAPGIELRLAFGLADVSQGGVSVFSEPGWQDALPAVAHEAQHSAGRETRRTLWKEVLAETAPAEWVPGRLFAMLERVRAEYARLETLLPQLVGTPADLQLRIVLDRKRRTFRFELHSPRGTYAFSNRDVGSVEILAGEERLPDLSRLGAEVLGRALRPPAGGAPRPADGVKQLEAEGATLWMRFLPPELQRDYRQFREGSTLTIVSNDASFPWELVRPEDVGLADEWWAARFEMARWLTGKAPYLLPPAGQIGFERVCCVATQGELQSAAEEVAYFERSGAHLDRPETLDELLTALSDQDYDVIHLACHGRFDRDTPEWSAVLLPDGTLFRPEDLRRKKVRQAVLARFHANRPLWFLNACHSGRADVGLTHLEGWVQELIELGCGAFLGCGWEVVDALAAQFAVRFYDEFRRGTLGRAVLEARRAIRREGSTTWLAYYLYGDPNCRVREAGGPS